MNEDDEEKPPLDLKNFPLEEEEEEASSEIFRKTAVERKSHPDQLDTLLKIINPASWLTVSALFFILTIIVAWAFLGSLPKIAKGNGIFMSSEGAVTIQTMLDGVVQRIHVKSGDHVSKGTLLAEIFDPKDELKSQTAEIKVNNLTENLKKLKEEIEIERIATRSGIEKEISAKEFTIKENELNLKGLQEDLEKKKALLKEGLISANSVRDEERKLIQQNIDIETTKAAIASLKASLVKGSRDEEIKTKEQELLKEIENRDLLKTTLEASKIYSPIQGKVQEIFVNQGDHVTIGQPLIWVESPPSPENPLVIYGYFPLGESKDLQAGQDAEIIIAEETFLAGKLKEVSQYPISSENIQRLFHSKALEEYLTSGKNAVLFALIELNLDPEGHPINFYGDANTTVKLSTGLVCKLQAVTSRVRPIYYLLPIEQFKTIQTGG